MKFPRREGFQLIAHQTLAAYMVARGQTVRSLAAKTGINRNTIARLRAGAQRICRVEHAKLIAKELDAPFDKLFVTPLTTCDLVTPASRKSKERVAA